MINYLVNYDHVVIIHVASLAEDIVEATHKYISRLEQPDGTILRNRFQNAINKFIQ